MVNDKLSAFLAEAAGKPYRLGEWDCGLWLADWFVAATGLPDPASHLRGTAYGVSEVAKHARRIIRSLSLPRTREPQRGDIGLVSLQKGHLVGGIFTGTHWCVLIDDKGIGAIVPRGVRFVAAWSCPKA